MVQLRICQNEEDSSAIDRRFPNGIQATKIIALQLRMVQQRNRQKIEEVTDINREG